MYHLENLIINVLILLMPIFIYQFFLERAALPKDRQRTVIGMLCAASVLFCMAFPYHVEEGYLFHLGAVALYFSFLYGGYRAGLITTVTFVLARILVGGPDLIGPIAGRIIAVMSAMVAYPHWSQHRGVKKRLIGVGIVTFGICAHTGFEVLCHPHTMFSPRALINQWLLEVCVMLLCIQMAEHLRTNIQMKREMVKSEKLQVVSELAASIAHEVRNPMTAARGFSQLLSQSENLTERQLQYVHMVVDELDRAHQIINDYLSFARPQVEEIQGLELESAMEHIVHVISPFAMLKGVTIQFTPPSVPVRITANHGKLAQAFVNILKNAIEARPKDGVVRVRVTVRGKFAIVDIIDSGVGMSQDQVERLGSPYYSTKSSGTGLGLMTTYRIIQAMGGAIHVHSEMGRGTTFSVWLPTSTEP